MQKSLSAMLFFIFFGMISGKAQNYPLWSQGNARLEPHKQFTKSIFLPLTYTLIPKLELSAYPLAMAYYPNLALKKFWVETQEGRLLIASRHQLSYPSMLQEQANNPEWFGVLPTYDQPAPMLEMTNEVLISKWLRDKSSCEFANFLLTWRLGFKKAFGAGAAQLHTLDYPVLFSRTYTFQNEWLWYTGLDLDAHITGSLDFAIDAEFYSAGLDTDYYSAEHKGLLLYHFNANWKIMSGYKMVYGTYPWGPQFNVFPLFDLIYHFRLPEGKETDLFKGNMF